MFQIVTEYDDVTELYEQIARTERELAMYKAVKLQYSCGVYLVEDGAMELRRMEEILESLKALEREADGMMAEIMEGIQ